MINDYTYKLYNRPYDLDDMKLSESDKEIIKRAQEKRARKEKIRLRNAQRNNLEIIDL